MPRSWDYRTLRVAGGWRSAPLAFRPASFARRVGSKLGQALPQHLWPTPNQHVSSYNPRPLAPYSVNSHVIPLRLLQTLNLHRWNCNVFPRSRKITVLNYVRNLSGSGLPSPAVVAARSSHRLRALRPGPIAVGSSTPSMPEAVGVLQQKPRRGAPLMVQFPPFGGGEAGSQTGVVPKVQSTSANNGKNGVLWAKWSAFWAQLCRTWCVSA